MRRPFLVALALTLLTAAVRWTPPVPLPPPAPVRPIAVLPAVTAPRGMIPVDSAALERAVVARFQHHPLARLLMRRTREQAMADRIARAMVEEANYLDVAPSLLTGVLPTENAPLDVDARSSQGAVGLMQVMNFHAGEYNCDSDNCCRSKPTSATARGCSANTSSAPATCAARCSATTAASPAA